MQREKEKTLYLAKQNLAFRGHREDENAKNKGSFLELLTLMATYDLVPSEHLKTSKNETYTSPQI